MPSVQENIDVECHRNHANFIPLAEFTPHHLPEKYRSQRNWALIHMKAILAVKLVVKEPLECCGSGCITVVDDSKNDQLELTVKTAAHVVYEKLKPSRTTVNVFDPYTNTVLESKCVKLTAVNEVEDIAMLSVIFERDNFTHPVDTVVTKIRKALAPNRYSLWEYVLEKYRTVQFSLSSFLKDEIRCIKHIEFAPGNPVLKMHLQVEHMYMIDVILIIHVFASHPEDTRMLLTKMANESDSKTDEGCSPVTVVRPEIFVEHSTELDRLKTSLWDPLRESIMGEINDYLSYLFPFKICVELTESNVMTMHVGSNAGSGHWSEEVGRATGQDVQNLEAAARAKTRNRRDKVESPQPPDVGLDANKLKEEEARSLPFLEVRNKTLAEIYPQQMVNEDGLSFVHFKPMQEVVFNDPDSKDTLAVLISYPHGQQPQRITLGYVKSYHGFEVFYTTPSCGASSGGPVWLIKRKPTSNVGEMDDIGFATHSTASEMSGTGVLYEFPNN